MKRVAVDRSEAQEMTGAKRKEYCVLGETHQGSDCSKRTAVQGSAKHVDRSAA